ncbi:hypothetical protein [Solirubrobacter pauli]|uniref:hypothetical protein n=1 Tax=Solirubrobacter pauli TaxID=166793 RepID=UPI000EAE8361|nr:hypothetical protein [Solirubrobacter pauli]
MAVAAAPTAHAAETVRWGLAPDGQPLLTVTGDVPSVMQWWTCPPSEACRALIAPGTGSSAFRDIVQLAPGEAARGTFFEGTGYTSVGGSAGVALVEERSPMWMGRVGPRNHPRVTGSLRVGQRLRPVGALWSGGWADDGSTLALVACPASTRATCEYLVTAQNTVTGPGPRTLTRKHRGWLVYAVDHRTPADGPAPELEPGPASRPIASPVVAVSKPSGLVRSAK